jgi:hypothetical protein
MLKLLKDDLIFIYQDNARTPFLVASDRLLLYSNSDMGANPMGSHPSFWQVVQVPNSYLTDNWPIKVDWKILRNKQK